MNAIIYEVTVPVTVTLRYERGRSTLVMTKLDDGFPGFFSEAEEAGGVWNVNEQEWQNVPLVEQRAWEVVQNRLRDGLRL